MGPRLPLHRRLIKSPQDFGTAVTVVACSLPTSLLLQAVPLLTVLSPMGIMRHKAIRVIERPRWYGISQSGDSRRFRITHFSLRPQQQRYTHIIHCAGGTLTSASSELALKLRDERLTVEDG
ncbi:hypothetical protein ElyMa_003032900 [Elysia marginata]|uniref:Uncharacterized protein n=1 Tax=Elysia marginata TaxID=1093978 RepID=A0AAV4IHT7_9GAST|nr:hypothetical protein ElyMa_003032900 [Elysia marginata]